MAGDVVIVKVCSPLKQLNGLTRSYHAICHYLYNLPLAKIKKKEMEALDNEKLISGNKQLKLTTHRLRYYDSSSKKSNFTSIMVDKISSIELTYQSNIWLLIIGIVTIGAGIGIILIILFYTTKKHVVSVTPDGGSSVIFQIKGMKRDSIEDFIQKVENTSMKLKYK